MTTKPRPQWLVPLTAGTSPDVHAFNLTAIVRIDDRGCVSISADRPGGPLLVGTPLEMAQLGQAIQEASRDAAAMRVKLEGRRRR